MHSDATLSRSPMIGCEVKRFTPNTPVRPEERLLMYRTCINKAADEPRKRARHILINSTFPRRTDRLLGAASRWASVNVDGDDVQVELAFVYVHFRLCFATGEEFAFTVGVWLLAAQNLE